MPEFTSKTPRDAELSGAEAPTTPAQRPPAESPTATTATELPARNLDEVVATLNAMRDGAALALAVSVGEYLVREFFGGDLRPAQRAVSFRALARHPELVLSASSLYRSVAIYELSRVFPELACSKFVTPSHVRSVLPLERPEQIELLREAEHREWSVRTLEANVKARRANTSAATPRGRLLDEIPVFRSGVDGVEAASDK